MPLQQDVYLADLGSTTPAWFDASTQTWSTLSLPGDSSDVVVSPDATTVYYNSTSLEAVIEVDAASGSVVRTIPLGPDAGFIGGPLLAMDPDGAHLYVAGLSGVVTRIETATGTVVGSVDVGGQLGGVATSPDGATVYVAAWADNLLVELDAASMTVTRVTPVDNDPQGLQVSPDGATLYIGHTAVTNDTTAALTVFDTATGTTLWTITRLSYGAIQGPGNLALSADGTVLYGVDNLGGYATIDTVARTSVRGVLPLAAGPFTYTGLTADASTAIFSMSSNGLAFLDTATAVLGPAEARGSLIGGIGVTPDQAPVASLTVTPSTTGSASSFDASASTASVCPIGTYAWTFGDGTGTTGTTPVVEHVYAQAGTYTVGLTLTTTCGTSTSTVFTGQTMVRRGGPSAVTSSAVVIADPEPTPTPTTGTPTPTGAPTPTLAPVPSGASTSGGGAATGLAATGADVGFLVAGAAVLALLGAGTVLAVRRNRS